MIEIITALAKLENKTLEDTIAIVNAKSEKRGAFEKKLLLVKVIEKNN